MTNLTDQEKIRKYDEKVKKERYYAEKARVKKQLLFEKMEKKLEELKIVVTVSEDEVNEAIKNIKRKK